MKAEDYRDAMALYAEADQRSTANLIELVTATVLRKLAKPAKGEAVIVTISPDDLSETAASFFFECSYEGETLTVVGTPLALDPEVTS